MRKELSDGLNFAFLRTMVQNLEVYFQSSPWHISCLKLREDSVLEETLHRAFELVRLKCVGGLQGLLQRIKVSLKFSRLEVL